MVTENFRGALLMIGSMVLFAFEDMFIKLLTAELPQALLPKAVSQNGLRYVLTLDNYNEVADILIFLKTAGIGVQQMEILETDLEQVFINLTGAGA